MLGLFAANSSLGFFLSLCSRVVQAARFLGSACAGLVCCKAGGGAGCFRFVGGAKTSPAIKPIYDYTEVVILENI